MTSKVRIVTWNCKGASLNSPAWDYLLELDPDVALLQDFGTIPDRVLEIYTTAPDMTSAYDAARKPKFFAEIIAKGTLSRRLDLPAQEEWIHRELDEYKVFFTARHVTLVSGLSLTAMSAYSPAFALDTPRLEGIDTSSIRLPQLREIYGTEILWAKLSAMRISADERFIVAGDLNSSETFDNPKPRGNRIVMDRLNGLGFTEVLRESTGALTPTFRTARGGYITHQLDHIYVTKPLLEELVACDVGSAERVFESRPMLSDHLPVIAEFSASN